MPILRDMALYKRFNIQRRLAWSLCKDDTHNRREKSTFFCFLWGGSGMVWVWNILYLDLCIVHVDVRFKIIWMLRTLETVIDARSYRRRHLVHLYYI